MDLAKKDKRILLLTADLGYTVLEPFKDAFPDRFFNMGVAEQNMVGVATGLAEAGFIPFVYSIACFAALRPYEFIRNGPIQHRLPVRIVGIGEGYDYGSEGLTHYSLEDVGVMRLQPGITVIAPADYTQAQSALSASWNLPGPVYYRLGKSEKNIIHDLKGRFAIGRAELIRQGQDCVFISMGSITYDVVRAAENLEQRGVQCAVVVISSFNPSPVKDIAEILEKYPLAITVEAHYSVGGLGSFVSEVIAERGIPCKLLRCGVQSMPTGVIGSDRYLQAAQGISPEALTDKVLQALRKKEVTR